MGVPEVPWHPQILTDQLPLRHVAKSKNLGGQVVMRRAAAARRRLLIRQNLEGAAALPSDMPALLTLVQNWNFSTNFTNKT